MRQGKCGGGERDSGEKATRTGIVIGCTSKKAELYATLEQLKNAGARILSVTQMKPSLEEFFMDLLQRIAHERPRWMCTANEARRRSGAEHISRSGARPRAVQPGVFCAGDDGGGGLVGQISIGIEQIVIVNLGLSAISIIGLLMAVFIGVGLVSKEIDKRTLYALLAKPVRRWEFLLGKFGGLLLTLTVNTAAMAAGLFVALYYVKHSHGARGRRRAGGDLFYFAEAGAGGGAGDVVFVFHDAAAGDFIYGRIVCRGTVRERIARAAQRHDGAGMCSSAAVAFVPFAEL